MKFLPPVSVAAVLFGAHAIRGHLVFQQMTGATNGNVGVGFGSDETVRRDGTARDPFQVDTAVVREADINNGIATVCGRTLLGGPVKMPESFQKAEAAGLPDVGPDGVIRIMGHQINADGGGPYSCAVDFSAIGMTFEPIPIEINIPGQNGRSDARVADMPLQGVLPPGRRCTGGTDGQSCLVRCLNGAKAGPFGGCFAFTQNSNGNGNQNNNNNGSGNANNNGNSISRNNNNKRLTLQNRDNNENRGNNKGTNNNKNNDK